MKYGLSCVLSFWIILFSLTTHAAPNVVVSIQPIYALVTGLMAGVEPAPTLLVPSNTSPHYYALRPSQAKALYSADIVIWVGKDLETFLIKPLSQLADTTTLMTLLDLPITRYPIRQEVLWHSPDMHKHDDHVHAAQTHSLALDPHIWLDPLNAIIITEELAKVLQKKDPEHAAQYEHNKNVMMTVLKKLNKDVAEQLKPVENKPFIVFHDAYQYFERRYHLNAVGAITLHADVMPSPKHITEIRELLATHHVVCVFREPQFTSRLVDIITENTTVKQGVLDPLGDGNHKGIAEYDFLIRHLSQSLYECLS